MDTAAIDAMGRAAAETAMRAAADYCVKNGRKGYSVEALVDAIREEAKAALPQALRDAQDALEAGMKDIALATFGASMSLAGIQAAKRIAG